MAHDPKFVSANDLRLTCVDPATDCSPCIDKGNDETAPQEDRDGDARWDHPQIDNRGDVDAGTAYSGVASECGWFSDMGAYEYRES